MYPLYCAISHDDVGNETICITSILNIFLYFTHTNLAKVQYINIYGKTETTQYIFGCN